jgi:hypothetical protein
MKSLNEFFIQKKLTNYSYLLPQFHNMQQIHIDYDSAITFINENKHEIKNIDHYYRQVYKVNSGMVNKIGVSESNRRVHSSLTSFPKKLRPFLCLVNEETGEMNFRKVTIDGKNTQPLLMCVSMIQNGVAPDEDFKRLCENGTLYDTMADELSEKRNWVKENLMCSILFTPNNSEYTHVKEMHSKNNLAKKKMSVYFKNRFPITYEWLKTTKKTLKGNSKRNVGGSRLACEIQKMEAELWIHQLLKWVGHDMVYITVHDSIIIFDYKEEQVHDIVAKIKEIGKELYGIEIPLSIEYCK